VVFLVHLQKASEFPYQTDKKCLINEVYTVMCKIPDVSSYT